jgi:hypothetical protein
MTGVSRNDRGLCNVKHPARALNSKVDSDGLMAKDSAKGRCMKISVLGYYMAGFHPRFSAILVAALSDVIVLSRSVAYA